jgi:hypothetical protein
MYGDMRGGRTLEEICTALQERDSLAAEVWNRGVNTMEFAASLTIVFKFLVCVPGHHTSGRSGQAAGRMGQQHGGGCRITAQS